MNDAEPEREPASKYVRHVAVLVGSLRRVSASQQLAGLLEEFAPASLRLEPVDISRLAMYREKLDARPPPDWILFRRQIQAADGVLFVAAESTQVVPAVIRNAIEVASHPEKHNAWMGKPAAVISVTPAGRTGFRVCRRLQQRLALLDVAVMPQPRHGASIIDVPDAGARRMSKSTRTFVEGFVASFDDWIHTTCRH